MNRPTTQEQARVWVILHRSVVLDLCMEQDFSSNEREVFHQLIHDYLFQKRCPLRIIDEVADQLIRIVIKLM